MAVDWTLVLLSGSTLDELGEVAPTSVTMRWERNRGAVIKSMTLPHDAPGAAELVANREFGTPVLLAFRRDSLHDDDAPEPRLSVRLDTITHDLDQDGVPIMGLTWADPLGRPLSQATSSATFSSTPSAEIAQQLIETENTDAPSGLRVGTVVAGTTSRDRVFNLQPIASAIYELADLGDFKLQLTHLDPRRHGGDLAEISFLADLGHDLSDLVLFAAGPGTDANVLSVSVQEIPPVNQVTTTVRHAGAYPGDPNMGAIVAATLKDLSSIAKWGKFELVQETPDALNNADLAAKAAALLQPDPRHSVQFTPDPHSAPQPWEDFWLWDTVRLLCDSHHLRIDTAEPVVAIEIDLDENLQESAIRVEFGEPRRTETELIQGVTERVYFLEHPNS
ncbi:MAG: hypothetical protein IRZ28_11225 [Steroidobacteraceae bacterium]|nr:hypothetical protein [Steroidobacteraceae bacterium]